SCNERTDCHPFHPIAPRAMIALRAAPAVDLHSRDRHVGRPLRPDQFEELPATFSRSWLELQTMLLIWRKQCQKLFANYLVIRSPISSKRTERPFVFAWGIRERH